MWTMQAARQPLCKNRGLRVNAVSPGPVTTRFSGNFARSSAILASMTTSPASAARARRPISRPRSSLLCSDGARWINGANLPVDSGLEASIHASGVSEASQQQ